MKHFIILLLLICNNLNSKLQAQETEEQRTIIKFQITNGTFNGEDITQRLIDEKAYLVIYRIIKTDDLCMANFWQTSNSQSSGSMHSLLSKHKQATDKNYGTNFTSFQWDYSNTYDDKKGTAKVDLMEIYKPQGGFFTIIIRLENLDVLIYKGFVSDSLDKKVYERRN